MRVTAGHGWARLGVAGPGKALRGTAGQGKARQGSAPVLLQQHQGVFIVHKIIFRTPAPVIN